MEYGPFGHSAAQPRLTQVEHGTALSQRTFILWHSAQAISPLESQERGPPSGEMGIMSMSDSSSMSRALREQSHDVTVLMANLNVAVQSA